MISSEALRPRYVHRSPLATCVVALAALSIASPPLAADGNPRGGASMLNLDLPFDAFGNVEEEEEAPETIIFYTQQFEGDGFFFCLDRSGSTKNGELEIEKREAIRAISQFSDRVKFAVVFYDQGILKWPRSSRPATATPTQKASAIGWISVIQSGRGTCVMEGLLEALGYANRSPTRRNVVIYEGDGATTCRNNDPAAYAQQTLSAVTASNFKRHQINSICVGPDSESAERFCQQLAAMNGGTYRRIGR